MKKTEAAPTGREADKTNSSSESRETESKHKEEEPSSSSSSSSTFPDELQGFTSAAEMYSVRYFSTNLHIWILGAADYLHLNMFSFFPIIPLDEA